MTFNKAKALRQAEKHVQQGKINAAIEDYTRIAENDPADLTVVNTLGDLLVRAGRVEEAIVNFSKIAESYRENGFTLKAIAMFKKISKLNPQDVDVSLKLATLYSQQGLLVEARQQYLKVADSYARTGKTERALEVYQKIADLDPENTSVRIKLAETYIRENMREQAHDAYVAAGTELIRKGKVDQGLDACLQALAITPESKAALTVVSDAYIQRGEPKRAVELLTTAFDKSPGDAELIEVLGRTYLASGMMDEAEGTYTTLIQLDKSRFACLLELGRAFAERGELDRAAEQLDSCVDVLISRREEDRAIDFIHSLLARDVNHVPSLQRLADIYLRIREDHNLINTLESLVEAAVRVGKTAEAIEALKQLVRLEPENPAHRTRLQSLGVPVEEIQVVPTGPFAAQRRGAGGDDGSISRDLSDAERLARGGDTTSAIMILEQVIDRAPDQIEAREHLRQLYLAERLTDRAALQAEALARLHSQVGDFDKAREMEEFVESINKPEPAAFDITSSSSNAFEIEYESPSSDAASGFEISSDYGFADPEPSGVGFDTGSTQAPADSTTTAALQDELEGVDFYIAQGYLEIARDTLDRLSTSFPNHPEIEARYRKLKSTADLKAQVDRLGGAETIEAGPDPAVEEPQPEFDLSSMFTIETTVEPEPETVAPPEAEEDDFRSVPSPFSTSELTPPLGSPAEPFALAAPEVDLDDAVSAEPGPTGGFEISFESEPAVEELAAAEVADEPVSASEDEDEGVLLSDLLDELDDQFDAIETRRPGDVVEPAPEPPPPAPDAGGAALVAEDANEPESMLKDIFEEFKSSFEQDTSEDFDTHYNLGIAYRDMELLDDAIEEFQAAIRTTSPLSPDGRYVQCCNMLGLCFMAKDMPRLAVMWFRKGLDAPNRPEDEYQALRFDLGLAYERMGEVDKAYDVFSEVYGIDINYREVSEKLRELQALKKES